MIKDIVMPKMGESITEGTILEWRKKIGDSIQKDEILLEIGTDKVDSEIPSSYAGIIVEILAEPNDVKEVGEVIARINTDVDNIAISPTQNEKVSASPINDKNKIDFQNKLFKREPVKDTKKFYTPVVMRIAADRGIPLKDLESIRGTGRSGRVTKKDILQHLEDQNNVNIDYKKEVTQNIVAHAGKVEEMSNMRKLIGEHMKQSLVESAHVYVMSEVDMTDIVNFVRKNEKSFYEKEKFNLTYTPFILDAVVKSLIDYPEMNSTISGSLINYQRNINIGLAVAIEKGLMVPCIVHCEEKNFLGLCRSIYDVVKKTRDGTITADELNGSTFTITNFGVFGVTLGTPIINQPNVGILGVGAIKKQPVVIESDLGDSIAIRSIMMLSLGFDHRLIDGAGGSNFINKIKYYLENMPLDSIL